MLNDTRLPLRGTGGPPSVNGDPPTVSVVIPALNEERNLPHVFARLPADLHQVILVDGGSVDRTVAVARELMPSITVVRQTRTGKGNALACGFAACTGDIVVMIDADGSTDPAEIPRFVDALRGGADFAKGSRFVADGGSEDITWLRWLGNHGLNGLVNLLFGTRFTDLCYGYNAFWRPVVAGMDLPYPNLPQPPGGGKLWGDGFEVETLMNIRVADRGYQVQEVPSVEYPRIHGTSNLDTFGDGMRVLRTIVREYRQRARAARPARRTLRALATASVQLTRQRGR
jgi:glycosyltransferase involved in cell wall biosynthesis